MTRPEKNTSHSLNENAALAHIQDMDPLLHDAALPHRSRIFSRVQPKRTNAALFQALCSSIVSQQLSTKAAQSIFARLTALLGTITPESILAAPEERLRSAGLSYSKIKSLKALAEEIVHKRLNLLSLKKVPAEEAVTQLTKIYGIGPWTAEMFLIFALGAPDIFSPGDLILARRLQNLYGLPENTPKKELARIAERWSPHRSFVSLLFWKLHHAELDARKNSSQ